jgi:hypothetical protein
MTQVPPPPSAPYPPQGFPQPAPASGNGAAIASLICGIVGCIPLINLVAIILGFIGLGKSKQPGAGGKGLAIAGIVLGLIWLFVHVGLVGAGVWGWGKVNQLVREPTQTIGSTFLNNLASGNTSAAEGVTTGRFSAEQLETLAGQIRSLGKFKNFTFRNFQPLDATGTVRKFRVGGAANFDGGSRNFTATIQLDFKNPRGAKIENFSLE